MGCFFPPWGGHWASEWADRDTTHTPHSGGLAADSPPKGTGRFRRMGRCGATRLPGSGRLEEEEKGGRGSDAKFPGQWKGVKCQGNSSSPPPRESPGGPCGQFSAGKKRGAASASLRSQRWLLPAPNPAPCSSPSETEPSRSPFSKVSACHVPAGRFPPPACQRLTCSCLPVWGCPVFCFLLLLRLPPFLEVAAVSPCTQACCRPSARHLPPEKGLVVAAGRPKLPRSSCTQDKPCGVAILHPAPAQQPPGGSPTSCPCSAPTGVPQGPRSDPTGHGVLVTSQWVGSAVRSSLEHLVGRTVLCSARQPAWPIRG